MRFNLFGWNLGWRIRRNCNWLLTRQSISKITKIELPDSNPTAAILHFPDTQITIYYPTKKENSTQFWELLYVTMKPNGELL